MVHLTGNIRGEIPFRLTLKSKVIHNMDGDITHMIADFEVNKKNL